MNRLEMLRNEDPLIKTIRAMVVEEYERLKKESKNYSELKKKCSQRYKEIIYRDKLLGMLVKEIFEKQIKKDLGNIDCLPDEN